MRGPLLLLLLIVGLSGVFSGHSLHFYETTVSVPGHGLPLYTEVGYVDGIEITRYSSDVGRVVPVAPWMQKVENPDYWERQTQRCKVNEAGSRHEVKVLMNRFNQTTVRPEVKVSDQTVNGVTKLHCQVYGFYPRDVDVKWQKNGIDVPSHEAKHVFPNSDGTYQIRVTVEVPAEDREGHSCHVDHASLDQTLTVKWEPQSSSNTLWIVSSVVVAGVIVIAAAGFIIWKKRSVKKTIYSPTDTSEVDGSSVSSHT